MAGYTPQLGRQYAVQVAQRLGLDPRVFTAQLQQESGFRADAVSPVGARGPGQIMPATWSDPGFGLSFEGDINDPYANIEASAKYQRAMLDRYNGDTRKALAAYNWGAGNADKWSGDPSALPDETRNYLSTILGNASRGGDADILSLASRNGPVTIADEAANEPAEPRSIMQQVREGTTFHGGNALQSLGAAITATSLGESAAPALGQIRDQYYAEQEAEFAKQQAEQQRIAMIDMVGADSEFGQALANGADPQAVLQAYMQSQGFGHDRAMAAQGFGYDQILQDDAQSHAYGMQERGFGHDVNMAGVQYGYQRAGARDDFSMQRTRDAELHDYALGEKYVDHGYRRAEQDRAAELDATKDQRAIDAANAQARAVGEANREASALAAEAVGDKAKAQAIRNMPVTAFSDTSMVGQTNDILFPKQGQTIKIGDGSIPGLGKLAEDYTYIPDPNSPVGVKVDEQGVPIAIPVPGSKAATELAEEKAETAKANDNAARNNVMRGSHVLRGLDYAIENTNGMTAGFVGSIMGMIPGTEATTLQATLDTIDSNIAFDRLSQMRAESPTGGALGSITEGELKLLRSTIASTAREQRPEKLRENLEYIKQQYVSMIDKVQASDASPAAKAEALKMLGVELGSDGPAGSEDADGWTTHNGVKIREKR